jgi:hypothetical protein
MPANSDDRDSGCGYNFDDEILQREDTLKHFLKQHEDSDISQDVQLTSAMETSPVRCPASTPSSPGSGSITKASDCESTFALAEVGATSILLSRSADSGSRHSDTQQPSALKPQDFNFTKSTAAIPHTRTGVMNAANILPISSRGTKRKFGREIDTNAALSTRKAPNPHISMSKENKASFCVLHESVLNPLPRTVNQALRPKLPLQNVDPPHPRRPPPPPPNTSIPHRTQSATHTHANQNSY